MSTTTRELSPEVLAQIDALCDAMDREHIPAGMWFPPSETYPPGGTILDACRAMWIEQAQQGLPLPERWGSDRHEALVQKRFAEHGTREWRKAHPWMVELLKDEPTGASAGDAPVTEPQEPAGPVT